MIWKILDTFMADPLAGFIFLGMYGFMGFMYYAMFFGPLNIFLSAPVYTCTF